MKQLAKLTSSTMLALGYAQKSLAKMPELEVWPGTTWYWLDISHQNISAKKWGAGYEAKKVEFFGWLPCLRYARATVTLYGINGYWNFEKVETREWSELSIEIIGNTKTFTKKDFE